MTFSVDGTTDFISLIDYDELSHVLLLTFTRYNKMDSMAALNAMSKLALSEMSWLEIKNVIDKLHCRVCKDSNFNFFKCLLERDNMWKNGMVKCYVI